MVTGVCSPVSNAESLLQSPILNMIRLGRQLVQSIGYGVWPRVLGLDYRCTVAKLG